LNDNRSTVSRADRAGLLLSVCTVLLLIGAGYAMFRLQASYRELNKSNRDLESVNNTLEERVTDRTQELSSAYDDLKESQVQLVQAEKMSSLGELVAGISHEINTPLWYLISNSTILQERMDLVSEFTGIAEKMIGNVKSHSDVKEAISRALIDMQHMLSDGFREDIDEAKDLIQDSIDGLEELTELAQSLKDFSRLDRARYGEFDVNEGIDKTLLITKNKLKNKVTVHKQYGDVPAIHCSPSQINQVFLNLLINAADAIEESGDIRCEFVDGRLPGHVASPGHVWGYQQVRPVIVEQRVAINRWFLWQNVYCCCSDLIVLQRCDQGRGINQSAARSINQYGIGFHFPEFVATE